MVSGLLPALQFYEFYLIKSIKMGNRFKDLGKLSFFPIVAFGRIQYSWIGGFFFQSHLNKTMSYSRTEKLLYSTSVPTAGRKHGPWHIRVWRTRTRMSRWAWTCNPRRTSLGDTECSVGIIQCLRLCALWLLSVHPKQDLQHHHLLPHPLAKVPHIYIFVSMYTFVYMHAFVCTCM